MGAVYFLTSRHGSIVVYKACGRPRTDQQLYKGGQPYRYLEAKNMSEQDDMEFIEEMAELARRMREAADFYVKYAVPLPAAA